MALRYLGGWYSIHADMKSLRLLAALALALLSGSVASAAGTFSLGTTRIEIAVPSLLNHMPVRLPITHSVSLSGMSVSSNSSWVIPTINLATDELVLTFATTGQTGPDFPATVSLTDGTTTIQVSVNVIFSPVNIVRLIDDPARSRTYGLQQYGDDPGCIVIFDSLRQTYIGCVTVGRHAVDFAVKSDGTELLAICQADPALYPINLATLQAGQPIALPAFAQWTSPFGVATSAHVAYGPGSTVYYTDSGLIPALRVLNRSTGAVIQTLATSAGPGDSSGKGFGTITFVPDQSTLITWGQEGWSDSVGDAKVVRFFAQPDGTLAFGSKGTFSFFDAPFNTPILVSADGSLISVKTLALTASGANVLRTFPSDIVAMSPHGEVVSTLKGIYEAATGAQLYTFPVNTPIQAITSDGSQLVYFDTSTRAIRSLGLTAIVGSDVLKPNISPQTASIVLSPAQLSWPPVVGAASYQVYLGTDAGIVGGATPYAAEYRGSFSTPAFALPAALTAGTTYYWRVDALNGTDVTVGEVRSFTVAPIAVSASHFKGTTVQGDPNCIMTVDLSSAGSTQAWTASASAPWIKLQTTSGVTPATLTVRLDASQLPTGASTGSITLTTGSGPLVLPVQLQVDPLYVSVLCTDPRSALVYAISEYTNFDGVARAHLIEIDCASEAIVRAVPVGNSANALTLHEGDGRIYVTNWSDGVMLAVDRTAFRVVRRYAFPIYNPLLSDQPDDAYLVSAGRPGRLVVEGADP